MTVSILVPFEDRGCEHRTRAWHWVRARYEQLHPMWQLVVGTVPAVRPWSKGAALADALSRADGDVLVLADADSFVAQEVLCAAVETLNDECRWVVPHTTVYRLHRNGTERVYAGDRPRRGHLKRPAYTGPPGGGITVVTREAYELVGGIDARFEGWGGEDVSFGWALETLVGPLVRLGGDLWHLWHPHPAPTHRGSPESEALVARYTAARHIPRLMRALIDRTDPAPAEILTRAARFRSGRPRRMVRTALGPIRFDEHRNFETWDADLAEALRRAVDVEEVTDEPDATHDADGNDHPPHDARRSGHGRVRQSASG